MTKEEKYNKYKELFEDNFVCVGEGKGTNLPLSSVNYDTMHGEMGDGTINLAYYIQYVYTRYLLGEVIKENIEATLRTLKRLIDGCYDMFVNDYPNMYFKKEDGFFLRDDVDHTMASYFNLKSIKTGYSNGIERIDEDPCFSPFVSQDQIWNLVPILAHLSSEFELARELGKAITEYVVKHHHIIYNPYYSAIYHNWTYLHIFDPYEERIPERNSKLKYTIKVKRGAYNWYFAYGFKKVFNKFGGDSNTFWSSLWYKPFIFLADRIYHPYICKWFNLPVKNTSFYSLAMAGDAWYFGDYEERIVDKFNESLENGDELFMPQLAFLTSKKKDINLNLLSEYLNNYPEPKAKGVMKSPIEFLYLYNHYRLLKNDLTRTV